jgi:NAD(P)-dependent dehydrogenase (short-subunit alcohol dehydrogenase family)
MANFSLQGHAALITGSSSGIGQGIASAFIEAGSRVVLHGLEDSPIQEHLHAHPYCRVDLLADGGCERLLSEAFTHEPSLDLLVCNVGSFFDVPFLDMSKALWDKTMRLNVESAYFLIQEFTKRLVALGRSGTVVITSSTNGFQAEFDSTAYDTSKGALVMMTRSIALSLAEHGIRVNGLAPGFIRTPLSQNALTAVAGLKDALEKKIALGRIGEPDDCAGAAVFLCSPAAQYITGHVLVVDGGLSIGQLPRLG